MDPFGEDTSGLVRFLIGEPQVIHLCSDPGIHPGVDGLLIIGGKTQIHDGRRDTHPADHELAVNGPVKELRMDGPHPVDAGFSFKGREGVRKGAIIPCEDLIFTVKAAHGNHHFERHIGHGLARGPLHGTAGDYDILIARGGLRRDPCHLTIIGGVYEGNLTVAGKAVHHHLVIFSLVKIDMGDLKLRGHSIRGVSGDR